MKLIADVEADGLLQEATTIHCAVFVFWFLSIAFCIYKGLDWLTSGEPVKGFTLLFFGFYLLAAPLFYIAGEQEKEGPCLEYEETVMYNAATKTMMPVRRCVKRGEWVKE